MCGAFRTKRRRTGGSKTRAGSGNGAVSRNGVLNKYSVCKNDAPDSSGVRQNAATPLRRRAKPNGPGALHTLETCVHYFSLVTSKHQDLRSLLFTSYLETPIRGRTECRLF